MDSAFCGVAFSIFSTCNFSSLIACSFLSSIVCVCGLAIAAAALFFPALENISCWSLGGLLAWRDITKNAYGLHELVDDERFPERISLTGGSLLNLCFGVFAPSRAFTSAMLGRVLTSISARPRLIVFKVAP